MKLRAAAITAVFGLIYGTFTFPLNAAVIEGIQFSNTYVAENIKLRLTGVGLLRYWGFKAYVGAFYLEEGSSVDNFMSDTAKRIELEYFRSIKGKDFGPATNKSIAKNVDSKTFDRLRSQIEFHNSLYQDVQPGDRYSLTYVPGRGTELALNGKPKGIIEGAEFAAAVFSIWLGPKPMNETFKKQILGR
jgi:Chalcone isomerase-like